MSEGVRGPPPPPIPPFHQNLSNVINGSKEDVVIRVLVYIAIKEDVVIRVLIFIANMDMAVTKMS